MAELSTMSVKGMILHHATTKLGWTREEAAAAFDEWFDGCPLHRERIGPFPGSSVPSSGGDDG